MLGKGPAKALGPNDFAIVADELNVPPYNLEAIALAESAGFGWFDDGRIKILPEPHVYYKYLPDEKKARALKLGLGTTSYKATKASGHYKRMGQPSDRYAFLQRMIDLDRATAFVSVSIGTYQIMGFNSGICGYPNAEAMFNDFLNGEASQLKALVAFLRKKKLVTAIRNGDFRKVENGYNGGGQGGAYAAIMTRHADKLKRGKWAGYKKGDRKPEPKPAPSAPVSEIKASAEPKAKAEAKSVDEPSAKSNNSKILGTAIIAALISIAAFLSDAFDAALTFMKGFMS